MYVGKDGVQLLQSEKLWWQNAISAKHVWCFRHYMECYHVKKCLCVCIYMSPHTYLVCSLQREDTGLRQEKPETTPWHDKYGFNHTNHVSLSRVCTYIRTYICLHTNIHTYMKVRRTDRQTEMPTCMHPYVNKHVHACIQTWYTWQTSHARHTWHACHTRNTCYTRSTCNMYIRAHT